MQALGCICTQTHTQSKKPFSCYVTKSCSFKAIETRVGISACPLNHFGKSLNISKPQFLIYNMGVVISARGIIAD